MPDKKQNELIHYGVLGMKWGKRKVKASGQDGIGNKNKQKRSDGDIKELKKIGASVAVGLMLGKFGVQQLSKMGEGYTPVGKALATASLSSFGARSYYSLLTKIENL